MQEGGSAWFYLARRRGWMTMATRRGSTKTRKSANKELRELEMEVASERVHFRSSLAAILWRIA